MLETANGGATPVATLDINLVVVITPFAFRLPTLALPLTDSTEPSHVKLVSPSNRLLLLYCTEFWEPPALAVPEPPPTAEIILPPVT